MTTLIYRLADFYQPSKLILEKLENGGGEQIRFIFKDFKEGELRLGESVELRLKEENGEIFVAGIRSSDGKAAFLSKLVF